MQPVAATLRIELTSRPCFLTLEYMPGQSRRKSRLSAPRRRILDLLKVRGPSDAQALALRMGISRMAVRQHLYSLHEERLVTYAVEARALGRPAKVWRLTPAAENLFPDMHADLCVSLVNALCAALGRKALDSTLDVIVGAQVESYTVRMTAGSSLFRRLKELVRMRTEEGFVAQLQAAEDGSYHLIENHCPIRSAAAAYPGFCAAEWEAFRRLLGPETAIERLEHMQEGDRRCLYLVHHRPVEPARRNVKPENGL